MRELNTCEIEEVNGGECTYAGQSYSTGAEIQNSNGNSQTCQADGSWSAPV
ncbi:MAG: hypothetical protein JKY55_19475 [Aliivibrio sp.]|uniref:hypothetical protein n=1 Tax=Aliivibrio sp. TaxID=1872443 RepID=UPI001A5B5EBC|nr:hypothetical protein [Aliivibrio sp.]